MEKKRKHPLPKVINIKEYLKNKAIVENTPYIFSKGVGNYLTKSGLVPEKEFEERYSVNLIPFNYKGENPDKTKV